MSEASPIPDTAEYGRLVTPGHLSHARHCRWCRGELLVHGSILVCARCDTEHGNH